MKRKNSEPTVINVRQILATNKGWEKYALTHELPMPTELIRCGSWGCAFKTKSPYIAFKYTEDKDEAILANYQLNDAENKNPALAEVQGIYQINSESYLIWREFFPIACNDAVRQIAHHYKVSVESAYYKIRGFFNEYVQAVEHESKKSVNDLLEHTREFIPYLQDLTLGLQMLLNKNIAVFDLGIENIALKEHSKQIVIFDGEAESC